MANPSGDRMFPGRSYLMKINNAMLAATVTELKHQIDVNTLAKLAAKTLGLNEVGVCNLSVARAVAFDAYTDNRDTGAFILIDRYSNETVAAGMINFALRRATNIHHHDHLVSKAVRVNLMHHRPAVVWFTGLPGSGKSTITNLVEAALHARGAHTVILDGDNVRHGLNKDLGFTEPDRVENIRRIGEVAKLMTEAGLIVLCSFISPFRAERLMVREQLASDEFIEVFVDTPLEQCIARDPKGLYRRALAGEIKNFTGVDQPYEMPENPELHLMAGSKNPERLSEVVDALLRRNVTLPFGPRVTLIEINTRRRRLRYRISTCECEAAWTTGRAAHGHGDASMTNWPDYIKERTAQLRNLRSGAPDVMKAFSGMAQAALAPKALDGKTKELIALGIAVAIHCDDCVGFHVRAALEQGASRDEVMETLGMAIYMGAGPSVMYANHALEAFEQFKTAAAKPVLAPA